MKILGIETSCDETAAAVVEVNESGIRNHESGIRVLSNVVASQVRIHAKTGGVVPEVAARAHAEKIVSVVEHALKESVKSVYNTFARTSKSVIQHDVVQKIKSGSGIDVIAVTAGPGLVTSLLVGVEVARTLAWLWKKPLVAVNHLAGHVYANWLPPLRHSERSEESLTPAMVKRSPRRFAPRDDGLVEFPALCLIVSGGHTELVLMRKHLDFEIIGSTRDDAAGEAFDKVAKMLGLGYPGGPAISALAEKIQITKSKSQTNPKSPIPKTNNLITQLLNNSITFPRPMIDSPDFDFSFSGLKTAVLYWLREYLQKNRAGKNLTIVSFLPQHVLERVCYEFQEAVVDVLVAKTIRAAQHYKVKTVLLGGGVAANQRLRQRLQQAIVTLTPVTCNLPPSIYTTDNAAMIAAAGYFMAREKRFTSWQKLDVDPNWALGKPQKSLI